MLDPRNELSKSQKIFAKAFYMLHQVYMEDLKNRKHVNKFLKRFLKHIAMEYFFVDRWLKAVWNENVKRKKLTQEYLARSLRKTTEKFFYESEIVKYYSFLKRIKRYLPEEVYQAGEELLKERYQQRLERRKRAEES